MKRRNVLAAALAALVIPALSSAQTWPERPLTLVVGQPAGGSSDAIARLVARHLQTRLNQPVVVENRPGASANIANQHVARSAGDGYTLLLTAGPFSINPSLYSKLPFDTVRDFAAVAHLTTSPSVIVVHESSPLRTIEDLVALAKGSATPVPYASAGIGTAQHLAMELLKAKAGLNVSHISYKGGAPALADLVGGHMKLGVLGYPDAAQQLKAGRIRALAVTSEKAFPLLPGVPSLMEKGLADSGTGGWTGIHVPSATPQSIIQQLNRHINEILLQPDVREMVAGQGFEAQSGSPEKFDAFVKQQIADWKRAVEISGARVE